MSGRLLGGAAGGPSGVNQRWPIVLTDDRSAAGSWGLGDSIQERHQFLRNKKQEWEEYRSEVTPFELRKNLQVL
ncbi:hypothetical protein ABT093_10250 [Kitasatospora sp. NPDC002551]|uniref:hypothetical protein n=1 Tax=Kitasatospora sp. NPDC002551 TaxID=3154539 RepID=UPI00331E8B3F